MAAGSRNSYGDAKNQFSSYSIKLCHSCWKFRTLRIGLTAVWLETANLLLKRRCGLNSNYCPGWRGFKFAVTLNIFTPAGALRYAVCQELWSLLCTEFGFAVLIANDILRSYYWLLMANWQQRAMTWDRYTSQCFDVTEDDSILR